ncbi:MAG: PEGA domain-containing protein [Alphaproteobacteria bacterium]|nr:PEGA domain-containing protein [Rickettsiales bacterium]
MVYNVKYSLSAPVKSLSKSLYFALAGSLINILTVSILCISLSGCATIFGRKHQNVNFESEPEGARVYVEGKFVGRTPVTVKLQINPEYDVSYVYKDYVREFTVKSTDFTKDKLNKVLCTIDMFPGILLLTLPTITNVFAGSCRGFKDNYFKVILEEKEKEHKVTIVSSND